MSSRLEALGEPVRFFVDAPTARALELGPEGHVLLHMPGRYDSGRPALVLDSDDGQRASVLTVHLPDDPLGDDEFHVRLNGGDLAKKLVACALALGLFVDTGKRVSAGYVAEYAAVWRPAWTTPGELAALRQAVEGKFAKGLERRRAADTTARLGGRAR